MGILSVPSVLGLLWSRGGGAAVLAGNCFFVYYSPMRLINASPVAYQSQEIGGLSLG